MNSEKMNRCMYCHNGNTVIIQFANCLVSLEWFITLIIISERMCILQSVLYKIFLPFHFDGDAKNVLHKKYFSPLVEMLKFWILSPFNYYLRQISFAAFNVSDTKTWLARDEIINIYYLNIYYLNIYYYYFIIIFQPISRNA